MKYLPILEELFQSDSILFFALGVVAAIILSIKFKDHIKCFRALGITVVVYAICEALSNLHTNYMIELVLLFIGTFYLGCTIGLLLGGIFRFIKDRK